MPHRFPRNHTLHIFTFVGIACAATLLSVLALFLLTQPKTVHATPNEMVYAEEQYPFIAGAKLDSCTLCHTEVGSFLFNPYGQAYNDQLGTPAQDFQAIENVDSDGDGYTNIQEIKAGTNPGDPTDHPIAARPSQLVFLPLIEGYLR